MARPLIAENITELVGLTPMLRLRRIAPEGAADVFAKLEYLNPGGSVKDRAAIGMIKRAEEEGLLNPGSTIVEATAGNTGIGLALIGVNRGYHVIVVVPEGFSEEKVKIMRALGAEVNRTPDSEGMRGAIKKARRYQPRSPAPSPLFSLKTLPIQIFTMTQPLKRSLNRWKAGSMPWS